jgi:single-strand DNA-binding protein
MTQSINKIILIGNLGVDPQFHVFANGERICRLSVATNTAWKEADSDIWHERTEWHRVNVKSKNLVSLCERKLFKGSKVFIEGMLETRTWDNASCVKQWTTEIVLRPFKSELKILSSLQEKNEDNQIKPIVCEFNEPIDVIPF